MKKIIIIGCPGSGKSYLARRLRDSLNLPLYYLDQIWHKPDKTNIETEEFDRRLHDILKQDKWIIDGNYARTLEVRLKACDTVFLLDLPLPVCLRSAASRIGQVREDLPWTEDCFDEEFRQFIIDFPRDTLPEIYRLRDRYKKEKKIHIFREREDVNIYINTLL